MKGAQQLHEMKLAFIVGDCDQLIQFAFRDPGDERRHELRVWCKSNRGGELIVASERFSAAEVVWKLGPEVPLASLLKLWPSDDFNIKQVNLWKALTWYFGMERVIHSRRLALGARPRYELVQPCHGRVTDPTTGWLSLETDEGLLEVYRSRAVIDGRLAGVNFGLKEVPIHHPWAQSLYLRPAREVNVGFDCTGNPIWYEPGTLEAQLVAAIRARTIPVRPRLVESS